MIGRPLLAVASAAVLGVLIGCPITARTGLAETADGQPAASKPIADPHPAASPAHSDGPRPDPKSEAADPHAAIVAHSDRPPSAPAAVSATTANGAKTVKRPTAGAISPEAATPLPVSVLYFQHDGVGRMNFSIGKLPSPEIRTVPGGVELILATPRALRLNETKKVREVSGVEAQVEAGQAVIRVHLACDCEIKSRRDGRIFSLFLVDPAKGSATAQAARTKSELDQLQDSLTAKLALLNAPPAAKASQPAADRPAGPVEAHAGPPLPSCPPDFDMKGWKGQGAYLETLRFLRQQAAETNGSAPAMAALTEFYLGYGLAAEAQDTARAALAGDVADPDRIRLSVDADIASLLRGTPISAASPLLAERTDCQRADAALWRALAAAAGRDPVGIARDSHAAAVTLGTIPEPLLQAFAFRLADAAGDTLPALRDIAGALRNAMMTTPEDESSRFLLQARIARLSGDTSGETNALERAAHNRSTVPGVTAAARLAELESAKDGEAGSRSEAVLADVARVYRDDELGRSAAVALAERHLRHRDYVGAMAIADESASINGVRGLDSRGAAMIARVLRLLLVDPAGPDLLGPNERVALYLKYDGYATPGAKGDDIRLGAARLMLSQDMTSAALDVVRQLSDETAATPQGKTIRAMAEAGAGDPAAALLLLHELPPTPDHQRIAADALARMGKPEEAAHQLDGALGLDDRLRRARLLCEAKSWAEASAAYSDLLHDPALTAEARREAADRYGLALALSGSNPDKSVPNVKDGLAARVIASLPGPAGNGHPASGAPLSMSVVNGALQRARQIETLLPGDASDKGS